MALSATGVLTCTLRSHPQTPCSEVDEVVADIGVADDALVVRYALVGALDRIRIPTAGTSLEPDRLWAHTCFEMFVAPPLGETYLEWNFSPTGQIARFSFSGYRTAIPCVPTTVGDSVVTVHGRALRLEARAPLTPELCEAARNAPGLRISFTAVVEDATGALSYWALRHPRDRPDFHDLEGFALALTLGPPIAIVQR